MKKRRTRGFINALAPVLAGAFLFSCPSGAVVALAERREPFKERFARGTKIDGIPVGGMKREEGLRLLRKSVEGQKPRLKVLSPKGEYLFSCPELGFSDDFDELFFTAEKYGEYEGGVKWYLKGLDEKVERIVADNARRPLDATVAFSPSGFSYSPERTGICCDGEQLKADILSALSSPPVLRSDGYRFETVRLQTFDAFPRVTGAEIKKRTEKLASFVTYFSEEDGGRCENIRLAASFLDGSSVLPQQIFSFNAAVGKRTKERGFKEAKIIEDGKFVSGVGGGVCQVSTTLYNAALLAGLTVTARAAHSLAVSYVEPSRDAMVSSASDFKFKNPFSVPVYLSVKTGKGYIAATFYGKPDGYSYKIVSEKVGEIEPPEPEIRYGEEEGEIKKARSGIRSEAYLEKYLGDSLVFRKRLHSDSYAPTRGIIGKKNDNRTKKTP